VVLGKEPVHHSRTSSWGEALTYVEFVLFAAKSWEALLEIPSACLCLIVFKQLNVAVLLPSEGVVCQMGPTKASVVVGASEESLLTGVVMVDTTAVTSTRVLLGPVLSDFLDTLANKAERREGISVSSVPGYGRDGITGCSEQQADLILSAVQPFLEFLMSLFREGLQYQTINTIRSAISMTYDHY